MAFFVSGFVGTPNIFLIGPMGSGKSAVGKGLARSLSMIFIDSDEEIQRRTGVDIPYIFEREGEAGFRQRESRVIEEVVQRPGIVFATGGGAILAEENRRQLSGNGFVVYLQTSAEQSLARTAHSRHRPLLDNDDPRAVLEQLLAVRAPLYESIASLTVDTDNRKVGSVVHEIVRHLEQRS